MSSMHMTKLFARLVRSPRWKRLSSNTRIVAPVYFHEEWMEVMLRRCGLTSQ